MGASVPDQKKSRFELEDYSLLFIVLFLVAFGLVLLYSTSSYVSAAEHEGDSTYYLMRQLMFTGAGLLLMTIIVFIPHRLWRFFSVPAYLGSIGLILLVLKFGKTVNGAKRWLEIKGFSMQPSEAAKVAVIILTAFLIEIIGRRRLQSFLGFFLPLVPASVMAVILWKITNNMSSALIVLAIAFGMLFVACPGYKRFIVLAVMGVAGCVAGVFYIVRIADQGGLGFRESRVLVWLDPQSYAGDTGFQTLQALYAIGSGGLFGKGLGQSMQKNIVPEVQNDMIFSIICEELGLFGAIGIMLLFILLIWRLILVAGNAQDLYGALVVSGVIAHIAVQSILNIAVVTNTVPNTGVTLPFISYGGSSLFFLLAEIGIVLSVARTSSRAQEQEKIKT
ncbi:MAG: putative peptidoglycan glycosyltransferase FtsW [Eubacteriales bacterium]|nr:putative peptidoglycan glycosyltransferase FtsW [Eubacteriales bacterium]